MRPICIFRHAAGEGPGYLSAFLDRHSIPYELVRIDNGEAIPQTIDDVSGLVFMGGPMSVNDSLPWIVDELELIQYAAEARLPLLGHCLGGQLISKALGGTVSANPVQEIGWHRVQIIDGPASRDWLAGLPASFEVFHWHGETFTIPAGAAPIMRSRYCESQGFVIDNTLALQCHVEMTAGLVCDWAEAARAELVASASVQSAQQMTQDLAHRVTELNRIADVLYTRWLRPLARSQRGPE
jgi:GMP synthase-like glutamine amidotransferase